MINWNLTYSLATSCEQLTHWKRLWCWDGLGAGGERDDRGWDGWMASLTRWTWVWVNSGSWWWTGRPGMLRFMGSQRVGHDWATELNRTCSLSWLAKLVLCSDWQTPAYALHWLADSKLVLCSDWLNPCLYFALMVWLQFYTLPWFSDFKLLLCSDWVTPRLYFALIGWELACFLPWLADS